MYEKMQSALGTNKIKLKMNSALGTNKIKLKMNSALGANKIKGNRKYRYEI